MLIKNRRSKTRRRQDLARMKSKARRIFKHDPDGKNANHLKTCSCDVCGNPRKLGEIPRPEKRARSAETQALEDVRDD